MSSSSPTFALHHARVLEQDGGFSDEVDVLVEGGVVAKLGTHLRAPEGASVYDLRGLWLMPGVFDCHLHLASSTMDERELLSTPASYSTLETAVNLRKTLHAGVTFARDAGGADAGIKRAIEDGLVPGPRLQVSILLLSQTGGHGDRFSERVGVDPDPLFGNLMTTVDGVDEMRVAVRRLLRGGADWIKLCTSGGVISPHDGPHDVSFTPEEDRHRRSRGQAARQARLQPRDRRRGHRCRHRQRRAVDRTRHDADGEPSGGDGGSRLLARADAVHSQGPYRQDP